jgi:Rieske Fe-S protein
MNDLYIIAGVTLLVVAGFFVIPWVNKKGWITIKNVETVLSLTNIERLVVDILPIADKYKEKANFVLDVAAETVEYVNTYANDTLSEDDKLVLSLSVIDGICEHFGVKPNVQEKKLIGILVKQGLEFAGKVNQ